eukprot:921284-Pleurochrysis_carterae.AAC.2
MSPACSWPRAHRQPRCAQTILPPGWAEWRRRRRRRPPLGAGASEEASGLLIAERARSWVRPPAAVRQVVESKLIALDSAVRPLRAHQIQASSMDSDSIIPEELKECVSQVAVTLVGASVSPCESAIGAQVHAERIRTCISAWQSGLMLDED